MNQREAQQMDQMTIETKTNLSAQSNPNTSLIETMDRKGMTAGRNYRPMSTEKQIPRLISQKYPPNLHFTMQTDQLDSEETAIDNTGNENNNEQAVDNRIRGQQQNNQGPCNKIQHKQDSLNNKPEEIGSLHTTHSEKELRNPNTSQPKGQPPLITTPPKVSQIKGKIVVPKLRMQLTNDYDTRNKTGMPKSKPDKSLGSVDLRAIAFSLNDITLQQEQKKRQIQLQLMITSQHNTPKATRSVKDPRNRNKDPTPRIRQRQCPTPRMICWNILIDQGEKKERMQGRNIENCETDN
ncbi:MAG: hypothetical protein EZS28_013656 [Streblomastix strix]|uniref:Uncharacterized protein n=1 Tax=Streblomastix strix TaxID=222440 RepID=A0A5J4W7H9_9EUKA|nr:MAG: hypothetical protein EZS28_013656 [Streblomastix strix]